MFYARIVATGEVLGGAWSAEQDADFLARYAEALGVNGTLEMFESEDDPRTPEAPVEPAATSVPDAPAFKLAAYTYLGGAAFVAPLSGYIAPTLDSLNAGNWGLARQIIGYARQANALTAQQYADINALLAEYGIPEA